MTVLVPPDGGERLGATLIRAAFPELTILEYALESGSEHGKPHLHARHADSFIVLEGELEFLIDGRAMRASAGSIIVAPTNAVHAFPIAVTPRARFLNLHTPGGFERYIREVNEFRARGVEPTDDFYRSHDVHFV